MEKQHATHHKEIPLMEAIIEPLMATIKYILFGSETKNFLGKQYNAKRIKDSEKCKSFGFSQNQCCSRMTALMYESASDPRKTNLKFKLVSAG